MLGFSTYAALLPELRDLWGLSNSEAGMVSGVFFAGYIGTVSLWTALTDRVDARKVYLAGSLLASAGGAGFGLLGARIRERRVASGAARRGHRRDLYAGAAAARPSAFPGRSKAATSPSIPPSSASARRCHSPSPGFVAPHFGWHAAFLGSAAGPVRRRRLVFLAHRTPRPRGRTPSRFSLATLFPLAAWRKVLAARACAGYTARLRRALPRAFRLARLDGGVPGFLGDAALSSRAFRGSCRRLRR